MSGSSVTIHISIETDSHLLHEALKLLVPSIPISLDLPVPAMAAPEQAVSQRQPENSTGTAAAAKTGKAAAATSPPAAEGRPDTQDTEERGCAWCGTLFQGRSGQVYCTEQCKGKAKRYRAIERGLERNGAQLDSPAAAP
jgi:hypothetical protein